MSDISISLENINNLMTLVNSILLNNNFIIYKNNSNDTETIDKLETNNRDLKNIQDILMNLTLFNISELNNNLKLKLLFNDKNLKLDNRYKDKLIIFFNYLEKNIEEKEIILNSYKYSENIVIELKDIESSILKNLDKKIKEDLNIIDEGNLIKIFLKQPMFVLETLEVELGESTYLLPLDNLLESIQANDENVKSFNSSEDKDNDIEDTYRFDNIKELLILRDEFIPIIRLGRVFNSKENYCKNLKEGVLLVVKNNKEKFALFVDRFSKQSQSVVKPITDSFNQIDGIYGTSIRGDNSVCLVLDLDTIIKYDKEDKNSDD